MAVSLALTFTASSRAERPPFRVYTTAEGLAHDSVNRIVPDSRGFVWFCTADGLSRFDGYKFKNYTQDDGLPHRNINDFLETRDGTYLVATSAGLSVFNPNGKAYRWNLLQSELEQTADEPPLFQTLFPQERGIKQTDKVLSLAQKQTNKILSLAQDRQGVIWAGTGNGLFQVRKTADGWEFQEFEVEDWKDKGLPYNDLLADSEGGLFVCTERAVYWISPNANLRKLTEYASGTIFQDRDGKLWVDSSTGLRVLSLENDKPKLLKTYSQKDGLPPNAIHFSVKQTSDGRIFVGFEYGFSEFLPNAKENEPKFRIFAVEKINALAEDGGGNLWVGTDSKGAWKLANTGFTIFGEQDGISGSDEIMSVFSDRESEVYAVARPNKLSHLRAGKFESVLPFGLAKRSWGWHFLDLLSQDGEWWIPAEDGLRRYPKIARFADLARTPPKRVYTTADGLFASTVFNQFEDSRGDIWFCVIGGAGDTLLRWERKTGKIIPYTTADGLPTGNGPISFAEDSHGNMWFGYYFGGLARYRDGKFRLFTDQDGLPSSQVGDLLTDSGGRLWIATSGFGLFRLDNTGDEKPVFNNLSTANGLSSNQPLCLTADRFGRIYVGTGRGINRIDSNDTVKVFTQEDGLPSNYITRCAADKNGSLWFVSRNTLVRFVPEIEQASTPPPVFIDRIIVNGVPQSISELGETETRPLELESAQHQIQVDFFALTFGEGENVRYQYRLDEQDWSNPTKQQTLNLDLSPGKHSLWVRAVRTDGIASEKPAIVSVRILPPIWLRWWFLTIAAFVIASAVYAFTRYRYQRMKAVFEAQEALRRSREERLAELERVRKRIATDLHDDIGSSLTRISLISEVAQRQIGDAGAADRPLSMIAGLSRELVDSMSDIVWAINPTKDHLSDLTGRMRHFASDVFTARQIEFRFAAPTNENDMKVGANVRRELFLLFKEAVNNAVRHSSCTNAGIEFQARADALVLKVTDNGQGFDVSRQADGHGLTSMRERTEALGGRFEVASSKGQGTSLEFTIPLVQTDEPQAKTDRSE